MFAVPDAGRRSAIAIAARSRSGSSPALASASSLAQSPKVISQWERVVLLRLGRYVGLRGPGLFWIVPFVETLAAYIDQRVITTGFAAEQTLTADTVPVNVDAVLFWMVHDPRRPRSRSRTIGYTVSWAAQTALRDIIGKTSLVGPAPRPRAHRGGAADADRRRGRTRGASPCSPWKCATSSFRRRCRTQCRARRKPRARNRRA